MSEPKRPDLEGIATWYIVHSDTKSLHATQAAKYALHLERERDALRGKLKEIGELQRYHSFRKMRGAHIVDSGMKETKSGQYVRTDDVQIAGVGWLSANPRAKSRHVGVRLIGVYLRTRGIVDFKRAKRCSRTKWTCSGRLSGIQPSASGDRRN